MAKCCKIWGAGCVVVAGLGGLGAWIVTRDTTEPVVVAPYVEPVRHGSAPTILAAALGRLHQEALAHFHGDPKNGMARMPPVYEQVVKEWKTPWFSTGELERDEQLPFPKDMVRLHEASLKDFLSPPVLNPNAAQQNYPIIWEQGKYDGAKKVWEAKSVDMVGLLKNPAPVVYVSEKIPQMKEGEAAPTRPLDEFEMAGLMALHKGENLFGRSREGVIRLLGAVCAQESCLSCHGSKNEGDLLGAFSYTLREATYERVPWPGRKGKAQPVVEAQSVANPQP